VKEKRRLRSDKRDDEERESDTRASGNGLTSARDYFISLRRTKISGTFRSSFLRNRHAGRPVFTSALLHFFSPSLPPPRARENRMRGRFAAFNRAPRTPGGKRVEGRGGERTQRGRARGRTRHVCCAIYALLRCAHLAPHSILLKSYLTWIPISVRVYVRCTLAYAAVAIGWHDQLLLHPREGLAPGAILGPVVAGRSRERASTLFTRAELI